jgi:cytosol aminopeptidase family protein
MSLDVKKSLSRPPEIMGLEMGKGISSKAPSLTLRVAEATELDELVRRGAHVFVADSLSDPSIAQIEKGEFKKFATEFGAVATLMNSTSETVFLLVDTVAANSGGAVASSILKGIQFFLNADTSGSSLELYVCPGIHNKYPRFCSALAGEVDSRLGEGFPYSELLVNLIAMPNGAGGEGLNYEAGYVNVCYRALKRAKRISNLPPNLSTPRNMVEWTYSLFEEIGDKVTIKKFRADEGQFEFSRRLMDSENNVAEILEVTYTPDMYPLSHVSLIGKGVTFDAGGLALKPWKDQELMKYDKIGAVVCLLATHAAASLGFPVKITTYVVFCENLLRENSIKPGSVYRVGESGYVEVNNPDGEGRLLLADCLNHIAVGPERPDSAITVATLTGDSFDIFGDIYLPYFTNDDRNERLVGEAARESGEKVWRMPLDPAFKKYLSSNLSGVIKNYSNSAARLITSACFISQFAGEMNWVHFDMAGISVANGSASGRPLLFLINLLKQIGGEAARA